MPGIVPNFASKPFKMKRILASIALIFCYIASLAQIEPSESYIYAVRDTLPLHLDYYSPAEGSDSSGKPLVIFITGGGFAKADMRNPTNLEYFKLLTSDGFPVAAIDYRLGLKGIRKMGISAALRTYYAVEMGVEDLLWATRFLIDRASYLGFDPDNVVISGSSAGAIIALQTDWNLSNKVKSMTRIVPEGFRYRGVISYSGAIYSNDWAPTYESAPAPTLLLHGKDDKIVNYNHIRFLNLRFEGSSSLAEAWKEEGYTFCIYRYNDHGHEIAGALVESYPIVKEFLIRNIMKGEKRNVDTSIDDSSIKAYKINDLNNMYEGMADKKL